MKRKVDAKRLLKIILISLFVFISTPLFAQTQQIGLEFGSGKNSIANKQDGIINAFDNSLADFYKIGLKYYYTHLNAFFRLNAGIDYEHRDHEFYDLDYLKIPIGIDLTTQTKVQIIGGGGLYLGYLISYKDYSEPDLRNEINPWSVGVNADVGLAYKLTSQYCFSIQYHQNYDLTELYSKEQSSPTGFNYTINYYGFDGYIKATVLFTLGVDN